MASRLAHGDEGLFLQALLRWGAVRLRYCAASIRLCQLLQTVHRQIETEQPCQIFQLDGRLAFALQQLFSGFTTRYGLMRGLSIEPGAHLGLGAVADQITQVRIEPVSRRTIFFGGVDLYGLPRFPAPC